MKMHMDHSGQPMGEVDASEGHEGHAV
jgi:hypothetical protein